eukprot:353067-Chlamydomonas_euryale.AAC.3
MQSENTAWAQSLGTQPGHRTWPQSLGTQPGHTAWAHSLVTQPGHTDWAHSLGTEPLHTACRKTQAQMLRTKPVDMNQAQSLLAEPGTELRIYKARGTHRKVENVERRERVQHERDDPE